MLGDVEPRSIDDKDGQPRMRDCGSRVLPHHQVHPDIDEGLLSAMAAVVFLLVVAVVPAGAYFVSAVSRELRTPPELRGDWWTAFEREFRVYQRAAACRSQRGEAGQAGR